MRGWKGRTLIRGTALLALSALTLRGVGVLFQRVLAGRIGAKGMGILQLVLTVGGFAGTLASSGVRAASLQLVAAAWGRGDRPGVAAAVGGCLRYGLCVSAAVGAGLILLAEPLAANLLREPRTVPALRMLGLLLPLTMLSAVLHSSFTACGRVRELVRVELIERAITIVLTLFLLRRARGLSAVCAAVITGSGIGAGLSACTLWRRFRRTALRPDRLLGAEVVRLCVPLALNDYLRAGLSAVEQFLIPWGLERHGSRHTALAAYGRISGMVFPVLWFPGELIFALAELLISELARLQAQGRTARLQALVKKSLLAVSGYAAVVFALLYGFGDALGRALFDSAAVGRELRLFAPLVLFLYVDAIVDGLQKGLGQQLYLVRYNSFTNVIDVAGLWTTVPRFGLWGYLGTYCVSHLANLFLSLRRLLIVTAEPVRKPAPGAGPSDRSRRPERGQLRQPEAAFGFRIRRRCR